MKLKEILKIDINKIKASINPRLNSRRKSILVIDDDIAVGEALKFIYPEWTVLAAKTAEEGLDYLEHNPKAPDLIFLDYQLPRMDGLTCLNLIKERPLSSKIILLSGYEALGDILKQ